MKYVIVTGGVVSCLGKGITGSSIGLLLKASGLGVTAVKIDPYLNMDAGTMSPYEHGEVYVLADGGESDLDLGNYERFMGLTLTRDHNITTGKVYQRVLDKERKGVYLGKTVQVVPHVTDAVQEWIEAVAQVPVDGTETPEVCLVELGGTVGDIESMVFLEALRQLRFKVGRENVCHVHVSLVPVLGEPKTKPTQHGMRELMAAGLHPDLIVCRSSTPIDRATVAKISAFCMVPHTHVIGVHDVSNLYAVPVLLHETRAPALVMGCLRINRMPCEDIPEWKRLAACYDSGTEVTVAIVGKYTGLKDSYLSVTSALDHAALALGCRVRVKWVDSTNLDTDDLKSVDGILIPGGFGDRGVQGKIDAVHYARMNDVPFLGICLGMQVAVIESARHAGLDGANSTEFDAKTEHPVVIFMPEGDREQMGGTMRLGLRTSHLESDSLAHRLYYGQSDVKERHRHRYEVNPEYVDSIDLRFSGTDGNRMETCELDGHAFFLACQFHPEFTSRPLKPSPPFVGFVKALSKGRV